MKKLGVIVPWDSPFMFTAAAFNMMNWERPEDFEVKYIMGVGWCPAARHNDGVAKAQEWGADLVLFNGGDHLCPKDILKRMVARIDEGWDMVHAMPPSRGVCGWNRKPFQAQSYKIVGPIPKENAVLMMPPDSIKVLTYDDDPQQTHISGTGNLMMKMAIFEGMERPYFKEFIKADGRYSRHLVQDSNFSLRCTVDSGAKMFCDTSIHIVHLDIFGIDETFQDRFLDKESQMDWTAAKDLRKFV